MSFKVNIQAIGKVSEREIAVLIEEYLKRIRWKVTVREFAPSGLGSVEANKKEEAVKLWPTVAAYTIALDERGKEFDSAGFAKLLLEVQSRGEDVCLLLGGPDGHDQSTLRKANLVMSLSKMTLPHKLARLVLVEQIYRAYTLSVGHPYHRV